MCLSTVYHIKNIKSIPNTVSFFASKANLILKEQKPPELICTLFTGHPVRRVFLCDMITSTREKQWNCTEKENGLKHRKEQNRKIFGK